MTPNQQETHRIPDALAHWQTLKLSMQGLKLMTGLSGKTWDLDKSGFRVAILHLLIMEKSRRFGSSYVFAQSSALSISSESFGPSSVLLKRLKLN